MLNLFFFQSKNIEGKIKNAPDSSYEIGVVIGTYLPVFLLALIATSLYFYFKKKKK
jgi:hypothetical protein